MNAMLGRRAWLMPLTRGLVPTGGAACGTCQTDRSEQPVL